MLQTGVVERAVEQFLRDVAAALPRMLTGFVFLVIAAVSIKAVMVVVRWALARILPGDSPVYRQFVATLVAVFLWFAAILSFLSLVGLTLIAASLGTATGFLALGVSYALSGMIADVVAGVYLLRDPDFNIGDTITAGETTGEVVAIELRKTRLRVEDDVLVRANADIETQWTRHEAAVES